MKMMTTEADGGERNAGYDRSDQHSRSDPSWQAAKGGCLVFFFFCLFPNFLKNIRAEVRFPAV